LAFYSLQVATPADAGSAVQALAVVEPVLELGSASHLLKLATVWSLGEVDRRMGW
jgi:hypothetical protein